VDVLRLVALLLLVVVDQLAENVFSSFGRLHLEHHIFGGFADPLAPARLNTTFMFGSSRIGGTRCGTQAPVLLHISGSLQKSTREGRSGTRVLSGDLRHCEPRSVQSARKFLNSRFSLFLIFTTNVSSLPEK
jgi:hypothetical protein